MKKPNGFQENQTDNEETEWKNEKPKKPDIDIDNDIDIEIDVDNKLNKIKLNSLYKFIRKKEENFEGLTDIDRKAIVTTLKRLELYAEDDSSFPEKFIFELQLKIYAVTELYKSSYKVYLNNLTEKMLSLKFLDTQKYCPMNTEEDIVEFMNYLIVCLRNELKKEK